MCFLTISSVTGVRPDYQGCETYSTSNGGSFSLNLIACYKDGLYNQVYDVADTSFSTNLIKDPQTLYGGNTNVNPLTMDGFGYSSQFNFIIYKSGDTPSIYTSEPGAWTVSLIADPPTEAPTVAPSSAPVCFSGSSRVQIDDNNNDSKLMSEVSVGDKVLSYRRNSKVT